MKRILITGAGSGIGQATALRLAENGTELWLIGRREKNLEETKKMIAAKKIDCSVHVVAFDVSDVQATRNFFAKAKAFDVCVNNAAIEGPRAEVQNLTLVDFDQVFNINVRALFQFMVEQVKLLRAEKKEGVIVNVSSIAAIIGIPSSSIYCASKAAVVGLTKAAAAEQAPHGIRVNAVCPGGVKTPMLSRILKDDFSQLEAAYPLGRIGEPEEIAEAIAWLSHARSKFVIGHSLVLDGGATIV